MSLIGTNRWAELLWFSVEHHTSEQSLAKIYKQPLLEFEILGFKLKLSI